MTDFPLFKGGESLSVGAGSEPAPTEMTIKDRLGSSIKVSTTFDVI